jgi:uncharacterized membrane protein
MIVQVLIFGAVGVAMEVVFTALMDYPKNRSVRLTGYSYIWMIPIYGSAPLFLSRLYPPLSGTPLPARLAVYVAILLAMEYATGWILQKTTGECPWEPHYRGKRWAVHGLMRLDYAPAWAVACLLFEKLYLILLPLR